MARRIIEQLIDDIDGSEATETVTFSLDTNSYQIDLSEANAARLRDVLAPYIAHATPQRQARGARRASTSGSGVDSATVRQWARGQGIEVNERGRIPKALVEQYHAAQR